MNEIKLRELIQKSREETAEEACVWLMLRTPIPVEDIVDLKKRLVTNTSRIITATIDE